MAVSSKAAERTFLFFLQNLVTREEFVLPVAADSQELAQDEMRAMYPEKVYLLKTCYTRAALQRILEDVVRWPGVASRVQAPLDELLARVRGGVGNLPPLRKENPLPKATEAVVRPVETAEMSAMMAAMMRENALRKARLEAVLRSPAPVAEKPKTAVSSPQANQGKSVVELLRGLRG